MGGWERAGGVRTPFASLTTVFSPHSKRLRSSAAPTHKPHCHACSPYPQIIHTYTRTHATPATHKLSLRYTRANAPKHLLSKSIDRNQWSSNKGYALNANRLLWCPSPRPWAASRARHAHSKKATRITGSPVRRLFYRKLEGCVYTLR